MSRLVQTDFNMDYVSFHLKLLPAAVTIEGDPLKGYTLCSFQANSFILCYQQTRFTLLHKHTSFLILCYGTVFPLCFGSSLFKVPPPKYPGSLLIGQLTHA